MCGSVVTYRVSECLVFGHFVFHSCINRRFYISGAFIVMFDEKSGAEKACRELQDDMIMKVNQARVRGIVSSSI